MGAPDLLEWVLLVASVVGIVHHWQNLAMLHLNCTGYLPWAEAIVCRIYRRHERVRIGVKITLALIAVWLISQPTPDDGEGWAEVGRMVLRVGLVGIALVLDWESMRAKQDRSEIGRRS